MTSFMPEPGKFSTYLHYKGGDTLVSVLACEFNNPDSIPCSLEIYIFSISTVPRLTQQKKKKNGHWMIFEMVDERKATINRTGY